MSYIPRQKRQARSYWAELGFLVLGLFALQPSLLTGLFAGSPNRTVNYVDRLHYPASQTLLGPNSQNGSANSITAMYPTGYQAPYTTSPYAATYSSPNHSAPYNTALAGWNYPAQNGSIAPYHPTLNNQQPQYAASAWDNHPTQNPTVQSGSGFGGFSGYSGYQQPNQYAQASSNAWNNAWPTASQSGVNGNALNGNALNSNALNSNGGSNQWPYAAQSHGGGAGYSSNLYARTASNPFSSFITKPSQSPLYGNSNSASNYGATNYGADKYVSERLNTNQNYQYPTRYGNSGSFVPYQPQGNVLNR